MNIQNIDINNLEISSLNVRELYDDKSLTELVNNIKEQLSKKYIDFLESSWMRRAHMDY